MCVLVYYQFIHSDWNWVVGFRRINKYINWIKEHIFKNRCAEQKCDKNQKQNNELFLQCTKQCSKPNNGLIYVDHWRILAFENEFH